MEGERIYVDGSASSMFGSAYCIIIVRNKPQKILKKLEQDKESKYMEYFAILEGLRLSDKRAKIISDCLNVVREINEFKHCFNKEYVKMFEEIQTLLENKHCQIIWVNRNENLAGYNLDKRLSTLRKYQESMFQNKRRKR